MNKQTSSPIPLCPMAEICNGMVIKRSVGFAPHFIGAIFILLGITILIEPRIVVWVLAFLLIVIGVMMIVVASLLRKLGERIASMS